MIQITHDNGYALLVSRRVLLQMLELEAHVTAAVARLEGHLKLDLLLLSGVVKLLITLKHLAADGDCLLKVELRDSRGDLGLDDFNLVLLWMGLADSVEV